MALKSGLIGGANGFYHWVEKNDAYQLPDRAWRSRAHYLIIVRCCDKKISVIEPLTKAERERLWFPDKCKGVSVPVYYNSQLIIRSDDSSQNWAPKLNVYFCDGKFQYVSWHAPSNISEAAYSVNCEFFSINDFKPEFQRCFGFKNYKWFAHIFTKSNLPEKYKNAFRTLWAD